MIKAPNLPTVSTNVVIGAQVANTVSDTNALVLKTVSKNKENENHTEVAEFNANAAEGKNLQPIPA